LNVLYIYICACILLLIVTCSASDIQFDEWCLNNNISASIDLAARKIRRHPYYTTYAYAFARIDAIDQVNANTSIAKKKRRTYLFLSTFLYNSKYNDTYIIYMYSSKSCVLLCSLPLSVFIKMSIHFFIINSFFDYDSKGKIMQNFKMPHRRLHWISWNKTCNRIPPKDRERERKTCACNDPFFCFALSYSICMTCCHLSSSCSSYRFLFFICYTTTIISTRTTSPSLH
jgi:hypothetical protein